jgi:hypothetical protein
MGHACTPDDFPQSPEPNGEHPVTAVLAVVAILLAILLISWARIAVHGTDDLAALVDEEAEYSGGSAPVSNAGTAENEAASSRWATGFSH